MTFECHYNEEINEKSCLPYTGVRFLLSVEMKKHGYFKDIINIKEDRVNGREVIAEADQTVAQGKKCRSSGSLLSAW
jgi:hypothetical protein